jgi:hypothetical protein
MKATSSKRRTDPFIVIAVTGACLAKRRAVAQIGNGKGGICAQSPADHSRWHWE